ncbi:MAG: DNA ligase [Actinomycetota bacterium]|nr:DNA ligase [Actinomycetota bacterium]
MARDKQADYRSKRDTDQSGEPAGTAQGDRDEAPLFVVQRHDASSLHFDVRLEVDGVLVSWAVPKGPSLNPSDKRLAHRTEDHPLDYVDFEGRIDEGYGAGTVVVWDTGRYDNLTEDDDVAVPMGKALEAGHLKVHLYGEKLHGGFALTRTNMGGDEANWLLVKVADADADRRRKPTSTQNASVLTGKTNDDFEADENLTND